MGGVDDEERMDGYAKKIVSTFLFEGKAELEETVLEYISEAVRNEAFHPSNGRSAKSIADALRLFAPSFEANNLEARVEELLENIRQTAASGKNGTNTQDEPIDKGDSTLSVNSRSPEVYHDERSTSSPVPSRSPPAAAFLASSSTLQELLGPDESLEDYYRGPPHARNGSPALSYSRPTSADSGSHESGAATTSRFATTEFSGQEIGKVIDNTGSPGAMSSRGRSAILSSSSKNIAGSFTGHGYYDNLSGQFGALTMSEDGPANERLARSTPPPPSGSSNAARSVSNSPATLGTSSIMGNTTASLQSDSPPDSMTAVAGSSSGLSSFVSSPRASSQLPVRRSLGTQLSFGRISLNPNAAEFVPTGKPGSTSSSPSSMSSPRSRPAAFSRSAPNLGDPLAPRSSLEKSMSVSSNASDDEYRRYWRAQLPDELISYDDVPSEQLAPEDAFEYDEPPILAPRGLSLGPGSGTGPTPGGMGFNLDPSLPSMGPGGPRGPPLPGSPRGSMQSPSPGLAWGMNGGSGPPPQGPVSGVMGPPTGSPLHPPPPGSPLPGGMGLGNGGAGYGYGLRPQLSPHPSPPRGAGGHYSPPPGGRYPLGPAPIVKEGPPTPPGHGYGRPFAPPDHRPGMPTPFQLPPGQVGHRERPPLPHWGAEYDMGSPLLDMRSENVFRDERLEDPVGILAAEFPGFAAESLADIFYANGGDLALTMEMLTQLELQEDGGRSPGRLPPPPPSLASMDFPALSSEMGNNTLSHPPLSVDSSSPMALRRLEEGERPMLGRSGPPGVDPRSGPDFAAVVRKHAQQAQWQYERNGMEMGVLRGRSPGPGVGPYPAEGRGVPGERLDNYGNVREIHRGPPQPWLDTGEAVANMYAEMREEARDHARVRNVYFEQATQAYMAGNKALAKDLSAKGQWHNEQMKAAHAKAGDAIFRQRNTASGYLPGRGGPGGQARVIDLHGLHVNEAIPFLKRELAQLRAAVRSTGQRQQVFVCVGTGHHTKGRSNPRIPLAVERHLVEEERVQVAETQPGMLRVIV